MQDSMIPRASRTKARESFARPEGRGEPNHRGHDNRFSSLRRGRSELRRKAASLPGSREAKRKGSLPKMAGTSLAAEVVEATAREPTSA
jgi:hypothetical protein